MDSKESWKVYTSSLCCQWPAIEFTHWRGGFLAGYTSLHERYINICTQRTIKLFTPIIKSFVALKVWIQNERTRWFTARPLISVFVQVIWELDTLLSLLWTLGMKYLAPIQLTFRTWKNDQFAQNLCFISWNNYVWSYTYKLKKLSLQKS